MTDETSLTPAAPANLFQASSPAGVVLQAISVANTLGPILTKQNLAPAIRGKRYVMVEGWTLLGNMLGVFPRTVWTRRMIEEKRAHGYDAQGEQLLSIFDGWEACVEAVTYSGTVVGRAEAEVTRAETRWADADDYALRAMAQTRATSRAMRGPLGFVVKLAGMEATAFEEMPRDE